MDSSMDVVIEDFKELIVEFNNAEEGVRQIEAERLQKSKGMVFEIPSKYIGSISNQLKEFEEHWKLAQSEGQFSNVKDYKIFNRLLKRSLQRLKIYFRQCDCQSRPTYLALIRHTRRIITIQYQLFKKLYSNTTNLDIGSKNLLHYEYELNNREIDARKIIATTLATQSQRLHDSFTDVEKRYSMHLLKNYLTKCVEFHSYIQLSNLFDNTNDFFKRIGFEKSSNTLLQPEQRQILESELKTFKIPLSLSSSTLVKMTFKPGKENLFDDINIDDDRRFYPSKDPEQSRNHDEIISILEALRMHRWLVYLGEPGSGKTILAQYLTRRFAECLQQRPYSTTVIDGIHLGPQRVPILVRVGEFVQWLEQHPNDELIDYIGLNTWYGKKYSSDSDLSKMLIDFIENGHAFIIIDGLDEVVTFYNRQKVVKLVENFMRRYTRSAELISPFDKKYIGDATVFSPQHSQEDADVLAEVLGVENFEDSCIYELEKRQHQWQCESLFEGNMVIVTSRVTGYNTVSLSGDRVTHCTILPLSTNTMKDFVTIWCKDVQSKIQSLITAIGIQKVLTTSDYWPRADDILVKIENTPHRGEMPTTNPLLLSMICTMYARQNTDTILKTRIKLYEEMVNLAIRKWLANQTILDRDELRAILAHLAIYMQWRSYQNVIDEFDLERLVSVTLRKIHKTDIRRRTIEFMRLLNEDMGVAVTSSLCVYGFIHLSFQEYFAALYLTERRSFLSIQCNPETVANIFCRLFGQQRTHEVLLLAMGRISLTWSISDYNDFCNYLVSARDNTLVNTHIPSGSILLLTALNDLVNPPITSSIHTAFDALLQVQGHPAMKESCENLFQTTIAELSNDILYSWFERVFTSDIGKRLKVLHFLWYTENNNNNLKILPKWFDLRICELFAKQLGLIAGEDGETIDFYIEKFLILVSKVDPDILPNPSNGLKEYLLKNPAAIQQSNPRILATIISLFGGLQKSFEYTNENGESNKNSLIKFSPKHMHRVSPLSALLIQYFEDQSQRSEDMKLGYLSDQCKIVLRNNTSTRLEMIHSCVILLSLTGIDEIATRCMEAEHFEGLIRHMKLTLYYLRNIHCTLLNSGLKDYISEFIVSNISNTNDGRANINYAYLIANAAIQITYFEERIAFEFSDAIGAEESHIPALAPFLMITVADEVFHQPEVNDWNETTILQYLPFAYHIPSSSCMSLMFNDALVLDDIKILESADSQLLEQKIHPFQLLESKPLILILSFFPKHLQSLYRRLFLVNHPSILPVSHLLKEFLFHAGDFEPYTLRFSILITSLVPLFRTHKMESLLLAFVQQRHGEKDYLKEISKNKSCKPFTKILLKNPITLISSQTTMKNAIEEEHRRLSIASATADDSDQLYTSSICLADLIRVPSEKTNIVVETVLEKAVVAAKTIKNPLWKLDALLTISGCPDTTRFQSIDFILELENVLTNSISILGSVALIVRCLSACKTSFVSKRLFDKIFERLHFESDEDQQAVCEALARFPSLHLRVCHFINSKTRWTKDNYFHVFSRIFQLHSSAYATAFLTTNPSSHLYKTLSASMYLAELSVDIIKLEKWLMEKISAKNTHLRQSYLMIMNLGEECLHVLQQKKTFVSTEIVFNLSSYFAYLAESSISPTKQDYGRLQALERALARKRLEDVESASYFVLEWLSYDHHSFLYHCAHMAVELLARSDIRSDESIEKCCEILVSKEHCHCPEIHVGQIILDWQDSNEKVLEILLKCLIKEHSAEHLPNPLYQDLHEQLAVNSFQDFQVLIDAERQKHQMEKENGFISQWSLLHLIRTWPTDALQCFMDVLVSLTKDKNYPFLIWLLEHLPVEIISDSTEQETFCKYLLDTIVDEDICVSMKVVVIHRLCFFQENNHVRTAVWKIILTNSNRTQEYDRLAIACLRTLYWNRRVALNEEEFQQLDRLRRSSLASNELQQAFLIGLYMHIIEEPEHYSVFEVYFSYMNNISDDNTNEFVDEYQDEPTQRAADWIINHRLSLLDRFVEDLCKSMNHLKTDFCAYIYVADLIGNTIREKFCEAIRRSDIGENKFKLALSQACQKKTIENNRHIVHCISVYAYFHEFTSDYVFMLLKLKDDELNDKLSSSIALPTIDREAIDFLFNVISSTSCSHYERFCATRLLLNLEASGYTSIVDIEQAVIAAVENYGLENNQSDYDLNRLLFQRLLHDLYDPEQYPEVFQPSIASLVTTPSTSAPAIVFEYSERRQ